MLRVYCVYHEFRRTGMRGVDGMRAPIKPDVVFSSTALRAASPDGGLKLFKQPGWTSGAQAFWRLEGETFRCRAPKRPDR